MPDIIFHIGYHKTATTYLQREVFPQVKALGYDSVVPGGQELNRQMLHIVRQYPACIWATDTGQRLARHIEDLSPTDPVLYSLEAFLRPPIWLHSSQIHPPREYEFMAVDNLAAFARHAWRDRGDVYALVTIRHQAEWLASLYTQSSWFINASQSDFEQNVRAMLKRHDYTGWRHLDYYLLYQNLCTALGPDKVTFLAYDDMYTSYYWQVLNNLLGTNFGMPQNLADERANARRKNEKEWRLRQRELRLYEKLPKRPSKLRKRVKKFENMITRALTDQHKRTIHIPDDLRQDVMDVYAEPNRAIAKAMNRDLSAYGYY